MLICLSCRNLFLLHTTLNVFRLPPSLAVSRKWKCTSASNHLRSTYLRSIGSALWHPCCPPRMMPQTPQTSLKFPLSCLTCCLVEQNTSWPARPKMLTPRRQATSPPSVHVLDLMPRLVLVMPKDALQPILHQASS